MLIRLTLTALALATLPLAALQAAPADQTEASARQSPSALEARAAQLVALINGEAAPRDLFTDYFLADIPASQLDAVASQLTAQFGAARAFDGVAAQDAANGVAIIRMERAVVRISLFIDAAQEGRIGGFRVVGVEPFGDSPERISADLAALPGTVSAYFGPVDGGPGVIALSPQAQMPLGSTMKLYVLAQLGREIARGERAWSDVVKLDQRSFPSGQLQNWPQGAPVTLHTLASLMISVSDNTATDQLIRLLGEKALAEILSVSGHADPSRNRPWMTTRELFLLKGGDPQRLATYARSRPEVRAQILAGLEDAPPSAEAIEYAFQNGPIALDVEWFASTADLARLFAVMRAECDPEVFRIMAINPSAPPEIARKWDYVGYKGGSEPGVLNLTWLLRDNSGRDRMLTLSWADPDAMLDETTLELIAQRILALPQ